MSLSSINNLRSYRWRTLDGVEGSILGAFFEESTWTVKFIEVVADSINYDDKFLIPTAALSSPSSFSKTIRVNMLSNDLMETSKAFEKVHAVSERKAEEHKPAFWLRFVTGLRNIRTKGPIDSLKALQDRAKTNSSGSEVPLEFANLRKTEEVKGYCVKTRRKTIGHVKDFFVNIGEKEWTLDRLLVLPSGLKWLFGGKILVQPQRVEAISCGNEEIIVTSPNRH